MIVFGTTKEYSYMISLLNSCCQPSKCKFYIVHVLHSLGWLHQLIKRQIIQCIRKDIILLFFVIVTTTNIAWLFLLLLMLQCYLFELFILKIILSLNKKYQRPKLITKLINEWNTRVVIHSTSRACLLIATVRFNCKWAQYTW